MITQEADTYIDLTDRSCEALVLACQPKEILIRSGGKDFYIPSQSRIEEAFGASLRKMLGIKRGCPHWADSVGWDTIRNLDTLPKRLREGTFESTRSEGEYQNPLESFMSATWGQFGQEWRYLKGDFFRFREGKREEAKEKFEQYWTDKEKEIWQQIHEGMRDHTLIWAKKEKLVK